MKPIRWRKGTAVVEGVRLRRVNNGDGKSRIEADGEMNCSVEFWSFNRQQIDAAAYALADLVQTLRGLE